MAGELPTPSDPIAPPSAPGTPKKKGCGGCVVGCLVVIVVAILLLVGGGYYAYHSVMKRIASYPSEFTGKGYAEKKSEETLEIKTPIEGKTLLNAPVVSLNSTANDDLAIVAFVGEANSVVQGNLYFRGAVLVVGPNAAIMGDLDVECWAVAVEGYVKGEIKGKYQNLDVSKRRSSPPEGVEEIMAPMNTVQPEPMLPETGAESTNQAPAAATETPSTEPPASEPAAAETTNEPPAEVAPPPAAETPPASMETPPAEQPPAETPAPGADASPTETPPAAEPPSATPPAEQPPAPGATQAEPTPPTPKPVEPAPTPPAPPPPS